MKANLESIQKLGAGGKPIRPNVAAIQAIGERADKAKEEAAKKKELNDGN